MHQEDQEEETNVKIHCCPAGDAVGKNLSAVSSWTSGPAPWPSSSSASFWGGASQCRRCDLTLRRRRGALHAERLLSHSWTHLDLEKTRATRTRHYSWETQTLEQKLILRGSNLYTGARCSQFEAFQRDLCACGVSLWKMFPTWDVEVLNGRAAPVPGYGLGVEPFQVVFRRVHGSTLRAQVVRVGQRGRYVLKHQLRKGPDRKC